MSWRLIFAFLALAAAACAWAGLQLGEWLVAHGPAQIVAPRTSSQDQIQVLDANGKPFVSAAPQVLPDGRQGIPEPAPPVDWSIQTDSLMNEFRPIALATTAISMDEAIELAAMNQSADGLAGIAQIGAAADLIQPVDIAPSGGAAPSSAPASGAPSSNWQAEFRAQLKACENLGFFARPSCAWAARNRFCEPNNAWGRVADCPARDNTL